MPKLSALTAFLWIAATIVAQKMPAAGDADRVVASWHLAEHLDRCQERAGSQLRGLPAPPRAVRAQCRQELPVAIRTFVEPALTVLKLSQFSRELHIRSGLTSRLRRQRCGCSRRTTPGTSTL